MDLPRFNRRTLIAGAAGAVGAGALRSGSAVGGVEPPAVSDPALVAGMSARRMAAPEHRLPGWIVDTIGESVEGRPIERIDTRPEQAGRHVVVVCGIHGDERATPELADAFGRINRPDDLHLTLIPCLNPDGWAEGTRRNARGVDLNRNFPWGWPIRPGSGRRPASEPETQAVIAYLEGTRPDLTVWVHQPLGYVAPIPGCPTWYADIWSEYADVPVRRNISQVGGGESWAGRELGVPSMLIEVGGTREEPEGVEAHARALEALVFAVQAI